MHRCKGKLAKHCFAIAMDTILFTAEWIDPRGNRFLFVFFFSVQIYCFGIFDFRNIMKSTQKVLFVRCFFSSTIGKIMWWFWLYANLRLHIESNNSAKGFVK